jgi:hypothetical protein
MSVQYCWLFIGGSSFESIGVLLNRPLAFRSFISSVVYSCAKARTVANMIPAGREISRSGLRIERGRKGEKEGESVERGCERESATERESERAGREESACHLARFRHLKKQKGTSPVGEKKYLAQ